jgi:peptidoglycan/LPS O-acetylase OafA/YrhL
MTRRFHTLDGMRGIAAIAVTIGHYAHWFSPLTPPHGWLAVDLFFVMSGVVISHVYESRFGNGMTTMVFMVQRYVRFYPLFILGVFIGMASSLVTLVSGHGNMPLSALLTSFATSAAILPSPTWEFKPTLMPLNDPGWSLFFELFINLIFAVFWRVWSKGGIMMIVALSGSAIIYHFIVTGEGFGGSGWATFIWGFPRVSFSFFVGVFIARYCMKTTIRSNLAYIPLFFLMSILFVWHSRPNYVDIFIQITTFPVLVLICTRIEPKSSAFMQWLGKISYPLYAIHLPILFLIWRMLLAGHLKPESFAPFGGFVVLIGVVALATWLDGRYDQPVRKWLMQKISGAKARATNVGAPAL